MSFVLMTDSNSEVPLSWLKTYDLQFIRMAFMIDDQVTYYDLGEKVDVKAFYDLLRQGKMPTTMLRNVQEFRDFMEPFLREGKDLLYLGFSSALSGNFACANQAAQELREQYPQRKLILVDTLSISVPEGLIVERAAKLRQQGKSIEEVAAWVEQNKLHAHAYVTVDDLFHLKRGGRVTGAMALMGTVLNIKPVLRVNAEGQIVQDSKVKTRRKAMAALVDAFMDRAEEIESQEVVIMHGDCLEDAQQIETMLRERCTPGGVRIQLIGPVIGTHAGPGAMAISFWGKPKE